MLAYLYRAGIKPKLIKNQRSGERKINCFSQKGAFYAEQAVVTCLL
jgi:hypothetical protein